MYEEYMTTPEELVAKIHELDLVGRVIDDIQAVGHGYNWSLRSIAGNVYYVLEQLKPEERYKVDLSTLGFEDRFPEHIGVFSDSPLLIKFQDGDVLRRL